MNGDNFAQVGEIQLPSLDDSIPARKGCAEATMSEWHAMAIRDAVAAQNAYISRGACATNSRARLQAKRARTAEAEEELEVLSSGEIARAPLPMSSVLAIEDSAGAQQGDYFIELMRRRLNGILAVQEKWISRLCNQKHAKHVETQVQIKLFIQAVIESYESRFGKPSDTLVAAAPIRRRRTPAASATAALAAPAPAANAAPSAAATIK